MLTQKTYHRPLLSMKVKNMTVKSSAVYKEEVVDPEIYSNYKNLHNYQLHLSEEYGYSPWLDTNLKLNLGVYTIMSVK